MRIFIASEFWCTLYKGEYYLPPKAYSIYKRYSEAFGSIVLCSRFIHVDKLENNLKKVEFISKRIEVTSLKKVVSGCYDTKISKEIYNCDLVIVRVPSIIAYKAADISIKIGKPYLAEAMGDPWDGYWYHSFLGKLIAPYMTLKMKIIMKKASWALYVTKRYLQRYYPNNNLNIDASNVSLIKVSEDVLENRLKKIDRMDVNNIKIMTAAGIDVRAKGHRYVIEAMKKLEHRGISVTYYLAGNGSKGYITNIAKKNKVYNDIVFLGELSMDKVYEYLDKIDIYIQPSLQEGLPRSVIEAMSRGCLCLGARTAGIPELLDEKCIFNRKSSKAIADSILKLLSYDKTSIAKRNFNKSKEYSEDVLNERRQKFFEEIRNNLAGSNKV